VPLNELKSNYQFVVKSLEELNLFAADLANKLSSYALTTGASVGLVGELGSGKTTFVRALLTLFGEHDCDSPSYVLMKEYVGGGYCFEHWDLYRLAKSDNTRQISQDTLLELSLFEPIEPKKIRLIEWVNLAPELQSSCDLIVEFNFLDDVYSTERLVCVKSQKNDR
jgi:tRNA threonylcarbamoyl adenosine modification protein YjeE